MRMGPRACYWSGNWTKSLIKWDQEPYNWSGNGTKSQSGNGTKSRSGNGTKREGLPRFMHGLKIRNESWPSVTFQQYLKKKKTVSKKIHPAGTLRSAKCFIVGSTFPGNL